jgi:uncharacterized protein (DUF1697 family)
MTVHIALLRGINVGGRNMVAMADLRALVTRLGLADARTLLQSGNLVFRSDRHTPAQLERLLEGETARRLDVATEYFVRSVKEWRAVVARNPFPREADRDPARLLVMFLKDKPAAPQVAALQAGITGPEGVRAGSRHVYVTYPDGMGKSKLDFARIERALGTRGTGRNWNTVRKLAALAED